MKVVFADTLYWVARVWPNDKYAEAAKRARQELGDVRLLTTDEVLTELLNTLSRYSEHLRREAVQMVQAILDNPNVAVLAQSRDSFLRGIEFLEKRPDKTYSLTDCISMNAMRSHSVSQVLSHDHHFLQERFKVLITREQEAN